MALDIHFVNVGKGSSTIIDHPSGRLSVVDIDDSRAISDLEKSLITILKGVSLTNPLDYLNETFPNRTIFRFILTHPDMDHMSGIKQLFSKRTVCNFWDTTHNKVCDDWEGSPYDSEDWEFYQQLRDKKIPNITVLNNLRGESNNYWLDDSIEILNPHPDLLNNAEKEDEYDHISHVLKISHAGRSILICGDATTEALEHMFKDLGVDLSANVLLAPGHGSKNHIHEDAIKDIGHKLTIASVAEGVDYDYDFYKQFGPVLSTKHFGNIHLRIEDNGTINFTAQADKYSDGWYTINL